MLKIDLHIHSCHSGHAFGTIYEIIEEARRKNMEMIAVTNHGPALGHTELYQFGMARRKPIFDDIKFLLGCEANVLDDGKIDLEEKQVELVDILLVGMHDNIADLTDEGIEKNTEKFISVLKNYPVKIITHPYSLRINFDFLKVVEFALDNNILPELNLSYLREHQIEDAKKMVSLVKSKGKKLIVNSDAHFLHEIGDDSKLSEVKEFLGLTDDMIINNYPEELYALLGINK